MVTYKITEIGFEIFADPEGQERKTMKRRQFLRRTAAALALSGSGEQWNSEPT